ncbi:carboxylesterase/lipase family protein [Aurantiacibacter flavus]|uniref:Carboxylic ester hydrolase n=1 Tax=Aurantiacibacter flavus TaxID=3145232 RepID=A0ABV0CY99_9SPHN
MTLRSWRAASRRAASLPSIAAGLAVLLSVGCTTVPQESSFAGQDRVQTQSGLVSGVPTDSGMVYKGLPYAAPPVGQMRWRSPEAPKPWSGVRVASEFGAPCAQGSLRGRTQISSISREDCLYLNVWTPENSAAGRLPVMVWIHGGAFENGMGTSPTYDGTGLAGKGVIVVTINYRLGVFGFLAHPDLAAESAHGSSGNYGLEDQLAALRWVQSNIAAFGGDPDNVTLFGQSAGGASVRTLISSPQSMGLFARAIIQSGASVSGLSAIPTSQAEQQGVALAGDMSIAQMRALDVEDVIERSTAAKGRGIRFAPAVDNYVVAASEPTDGLQLPGGNIELLVGSNSREGLSAPSDQELDDALERAFGPNVARARQAYGLDGSPPTADRVLGTVAQQFGTDISFRCGAVALAEAAAQADVPIWQYQFEHFVPGREAQGAGHSFEVPYVFGNLSSTGFSAADYDEDDHRLAELMMSYWTNFAKQGDPNGPGLPEWPRFSNADKEYLRLTADLPGDAESAFALSGDICPLIVAQERP